MSRDQQSSHHDGPLLIPYDADSRPDDFIREERARNYQEVEGNRYRGQLSKSILSKRYKVNCLWIFRAKRFLAEGGFNRKNQ